MNSFQKLIFSFLALLILLLSASCQKQKSVIDLSKSEWTFHQKGSDKIMKAKVPGSVHMDLLADGEIPDPYYRLNEDSLQWIGEKDWVYETEFTVDPSVLKRDHVELVFKGLDTYARIFLNDVNILSTDNFFREWRHNVRPLLDKGKNKLRIEFTSPVKIDKHKKQTDPIPLKYEYAYTRKPAYHFGWDWGPVFITQGIWQPVLLESWDDARITNFRIYQEDLTKDEAKLILLYEIEADEETKVSISAECLNTGQTQSNTFPLKKGKNTAGLFFNIKNPKLWWTKELGDPYLYSFKSVMKINYQTVDTVSGRTGLRTIKLVQTPDSLGKSFYFELNGKPVFMKGANYIPQDMFVNRPTVEDYKKTIKDAADANMNMLRVWGGGFYEKDIFYDLCDENGILVWQDFMFACAMYPGDNHFLDNVKKEAEYQVKRLRNHPCVALWCGNNEVNEGWHYWGWPKDYSKKDSAIVYNNYKKLFEDILPNVVREYDPDKDYWPSSPLINWAQKANTEGDLHYWGVWHGNFPFEYMKMPEHIGRFVSEFGFQSLPEFSSIKKFTLPQDWSIDSPVMKLHQKHRIGYPVIDRYRKRYYKKPKDFKAYIYVSQVMQAFGMDIGIEAHRRAKPMCMGTLYWQLNDCYPVASWSSTDYYDKWKAMHYKVREIYKPVLVSPVEEDGKLNVYIVSDKQEPLEAVLLLELYDFKGKLINRYDKTVPLPANSSKIYFTEDIRSASNKHSTDDLVMVAKVITPDEILAENEFFFVLPKDLALKKAHITMDTEKVKEGYKLTFSTDNFAKNVALTTDNGEGFFTDNYFDLIPGIPVTVIYQTEKNIQDIHKKINIYSLIDSYE
jgi:beta-mannosidase